MLLLRFVILALLLALPTAAAADSGACFQAAREWIGELPRGIDPRKEGVLLSHSRSLCEFAAHWMTALPQGAAPSQRLRTCKDLVLIWSHKECIYFRDQITAEAYEPCKEWTRQMHGRCRAWDQSWFIQP